MKVTKKVHGELAEARRAKRATKATKAEDVTATAETQDATSTTTKKGGRKAKPDPKAEPTATSEDAEELVVFAFRLTRTERDAIHAAAGPARASKFVKGLAIAGANGDLDGIGTILDEAKARRDT
ncbi:MAG: hypothetical protein R3E97_24810 [Candidatus Eisenbacteria bacterium]